MVSKAREGQAAAHRPLGVLPLASPARPSGTPAQVLRVEWAPVC